MNIADRLAARRMPQDPDLPESLSDLEVDLVDLPAAAAPLQQPEPRFEEVPAPVVHREEKPTAPRVDPHAEIKREVHTALLESLGPSLYEPQAEGDDLDGRVKQALAQVMQDHRTLLGGAERRRIEAEISDEILGYGPLEPFLRDPSVSEVMAIGADTIFVERSGRLVKVDAAFVDESHLRRTIDKIVSRVGRRVDEASPMVDARLPDGSRVNAVIAPIALDGSMLTIRKFAADPYGVEDLIRFGTLSRPTANLLRACVEGRLNILISGGTGSGKTTTLNVISSFLPESERIVTIEDAAELQLNKEHVGRMETRPANIEGRGEITTRDLVRNSLRMRPDRIIVGEVRDGAALDMLQAMNTGHDGSLTTLHANSPRDALSRLETMVLMAGFDLPTRAIREQVASAVDLIVQQSRLRDGSRRITHITEVTGMEGDVVTLQDLFTFDYGAGVDDEGRFVGGLKSTGIRPYFLDKLADHGIATPENLFEGWF
ncbi:type II secretion system protein E [Nocardioides baekrokdamisoli]|uniref:Type II secretion system protein E n=1 Tax=Nocardioides baekrokdamisoli TaxID=1804624 RepID=A0A3G9IMH0_9ACTN|nr:CpaF family protein [Nocardioides baekrokdamisoli]BBH17205.1 type II secretion system protein E [Nocardioides baekrokdamisoli]